MLEFWVAVLGGLVVLVVASEVSAWLPSAIDRILHFSASWLPEEIRERHIEEWRADIGALPNGRQQLFSALGTIFAVLQMDAGSSEPVYQDLFDDSEKGYMLRSMGQLEEARVCLSRAGSGYREKCAWTDATRALVMSSYTALLEGSAEVGLALAEDALECAEKSSGRSPSAMAAQALGRAYHYQGNWANAELWMTKAKTLKADLGGARRFVQDVWLCDWLLDNAQFEEVVERSRGALATYEQQPSGPVDANRPLIQTERGGLGATLVLLSLARGLVHEFPGDMCRHEEAKSSVAQALVSLRRLGVLHEFPRALLAQSEVFRACGQLEFAHTSATKAVRVCESRMRGYLPGAHVELATILWSGGDHSGARRELALARYLCAETGLGRWERAIDDMVERLA